MDEALLDRPIWNALATGWRDFALGDEPARRIRPDIGLFAATVDDGPESMAALAALVAPGETIGLVETAPVVAPPGFTFLSAAPCLQMVLDRLVPAEDAREDVLQLGDADAPEMLALARLTRPGPFFANTHRLGGFIGVREGGRLIAMAGERMRLPGFAEVSGVCTHPDARGRGLAAGLIRRVCATILARGERTILHSYSANTGANALYARLGFATRREMILNLLTRA